VPVISYGRGGATETVIPGTTGLFFPELSTGSLLEVLDKFKSLTFNKTAIRENALKFARDIFKEKMLAFFNEKYADYKSRQ